MGHIPLHSEFSALAAVKDLERRWGLTLVSFVPSGSAAPLLRLQQLVQKMLDRHLAVRPDEPLVEFYDVEQLHCTQLTLTRSSAWGPVRLADFVKPGIDPQQLCNILARETEGLGNITVRLDRLVLSDNGFQLFGGCADEDSVGRRFRLLERLNTQLPGHFNLGRRAWDTDPAQHGFVHVRLGFVLAATTNRWSLRWRGHPSIRSRSASPTLRWFITATGRSLHHMPDRYGSR